MMTGPSGSAEVFVADDPGLSDRLRRFLSTQSRRVTPTAELAIRSAAKLIVDDRQASAPEDLVAAMVRFERRYGGLTYKVIGSNDMEYGLDGDPTGYHTPHGIAFAGILDGDWTWPVDVLLDGRTAAALGRWPHRVIDSSLGQRLEKHALLASVRHWSHRTFTLLTQPGVAPVVNEALMPPLVREATGPSDLWYADFAATAIQITLWSWPPEHDRWTLRYFSTEFASTRNADAVGNTTVGVPVVPADWCSLCTRPLVAGEICQR